MTAARARVATLTLAAAAVGYALGYALPIYARLPNFIYDPIARSFVVGYRTGPIPMGYYGQLAWGAAIALVCALAVRVAYRRGGPSDRALGLGSAWALTAIALIGAWFTWNNWP